MKDYLTLGPTPAEEPCAQVGEQNYSIRARREGNIYIRQLKRLFGEPPNGAYFIIKSFPHDYGTYHEVCVVFEDIAIEWAYNVEHNLPANWDDQAQLELNLVD